MGSGASSRKKTSKQEVYLAGPNVAGQEDKAQAAPPPKAPMERTTPQAVAPIDASEASSTRNAPEPSAASAACSPAPAPPSDSVKVVVDEPKPRAVPAEETLADISEPERGVVDPRVVQLLIECVEELEKCSDDGGEGAATSDRKRKALLFFVADEARMEKLSIASMREICNFIAATLFGVDDQEEDNSNSGTRSSFLGTEGRSIIAAPSRVVTHVQFDDDPGKVELLMDTEKEFAFKLLRELLESKGLEFRKASDAVSQKFALGKELLSRKFILKLVGAFHCDSKTERIQLRDTLHRILSKIPTFPVSWPRGRSPPADMHFVRHVINSELYRFIYETQLHSGIDEILTVYEAICRGYKKPLKNEHREFLFKVLMPLHKVHALPRYFDTLELCILNYLDKVDAGELDAELRDKVDLFWPVKSREGSVLLLRSKYLEKILLGVAQSADGANDSSFTNLMARIGCSKQSDYEPEAAAAQDLLRKVQDAGIALSASEHSRNHHQHSLIRAGTSKVVLKPKVAIVDPTPETMQKVLEECREKQNKLKEAANIFFSTPWNEVVSLRPLSDAMKCAKLIRCDWLVEMANANVRLPRCQEVPAEAVVTLSALENSPGVPILVISYPWLARAHPDELSEQLQSLRFIFRAFHSHAKRLISPLVDVGVFWDYLSLPQPSLKACLKEPFVDDRTPEENATFKKGLGSINLWYAHPRTTVILLTNELPTGMDYLNKQPYLGRGWCVAERRMSGIVKHTQCLINARVLDGSEGKDGDLATLISKGAEQNSEREAPKAPHKFRKELEDGIASGDIKFTHPSDVDLVCRIYENAFLDVLGSCEDLDYSFLGWGDNQIEQLVESVQYYLQTKGPLTNLRRIELHHNNVSDAGLVQLASVVHEDAMPNLRWLGLSHNSASGISEDGRKTVIEAVSAIIKKLAGSKPEECDTLLHVKLNRCRAGSNVVETMEEIIDYLRSSDAQVTPKQLLSIVKFTHWWVEFDGTHTANTCLLFDTLRTFLMSKSKEEKTLLEKSYNAMWVQTVLIEAFDSPNQKRRSVLRMFTYGLYAHCHPLRKVIDAAIIRELQSHVDKDKDLREANGAQASTQSSTLTVDSDASGGRRLISSFDSDDDGCYLVELLEILEAVVKGYKPTGALWGLHCDQILQKTLLPLHGSSRLVHFHTQLVSCTKLFLEKDIDRVAHDTFLAIGDVLRADASNTTILIDELKQFASLLVDNELIEKVKSIESTRAVWE